MLPKEETLTFEDRTYVKPETSRDEQTKFVENLRGVVDSNSQEVKTDTYNLGTAVPSNIGGLTGGEGYFDARYKTTQAGSALANLRAAAQASALNQAMANAQTAWQERYNEAQRAYDKRVYDANKAAQTLGDENDGEVEFEPTDRVIEGKVPGAPGGYTTANIDTEKGTVLGYNFVPYGADGKENYSSELTYTKVSPTWFSIPRNEVGITLPSGKKLAVQSGKEVIVKGSDGKYYARTPSTGEVRYLGG